MLMHRNSSEKQAVRPVVFVCWWDDNDDEWSENFYSETDLIKTLPRALRSQYCVSWL